MIHNKKYYNSTQKGAIYNSMWCWEGVPADLQDETLQLKFMDTKKEEFNILGVPTMNQSLCGALSDLFLI